MCLQRFSLGTRKKTCRLEIRLIGDSKSTVSLCVIGCLSLYVVPVICWRPRLAPAPPHDHQSISGIDNGWIYPPHMTWMSINTPHMLKNRHKCCFFKCNDEDRVWFLVQFPQRQSWSAQWRSCPWSWLLQTLGGAEQTADVSAAISGGTSVTTLTHLSIL